jgi:hypothetical protein
MFPQLALRDWVVVDGAFAAVSFDEGVTKKLPYIASASFGPPERAYGHAESPELYALGIMPPGVLAGPDSGSTGGTAQAGRDSIVRGGTEGEGRVVGGGTDGEGSVVRVGTDGEGGRIVGDGVEGEGARLVGGSAYVCWNIGELYFRHGFADYRWILLGALHALVPEEQWVLSTNAHPSVEVGLHRLPDGSRLLQLLNLSGFNGMTYEDPIPIGEIEVRLQGWRINTGDINNQNKQRAELPPPIALAIPGRSTTSIHGSVGAEARAVWRIRNGKAVLVVSGLDSYAAFHLK